MQIWTADGRAIYASRAHAALPQRAQLGFADVTVAGQVWRSFSVAMPVARDPGVAAAGHPPQAGRRCGLRGVLPLLLIAPFMAAAAWWLTALALRPLQRVAAGVRQRDEQSLEPLPAAGLPDEVAPLVAALNALLQRLGQSLDTQRAFVADAAHELRSPLTALKLQLQLLKRAGSEAERGAAADALAAGIERAARLVEQLLTLARTEPGAARCRVAAPRPERAGARGGGRHRAAGAWRAARASSCRADAPVRIDGDRAALAALVRNLADNAVRYSPPGARVEVRVSQPDGVPTLQVDDAGPGIPPAERERVFDRFYRRGRGRRARHRPGPGHRAQRGAAPRRHGATGRFAAGRLARHAALRLRCVQCSAPRQHRELNAGWRDRPRRVEKDGLSLATGVAIVRARPVLHDRKSAHRWRPA